MLRSVRRAVPWVLVGLLLAGAGAGAELGTVMGAGPTSAAALLPRILAATRASGSARFSFRSQTDSANPQLRSTSSGAGVVDFASGALSSQVTERATGSSSTNGGPVVVQTELETIREVDVGSARYLSFEPEGAPSASLSSWVRLEVPRSFEVSPLLDVLERGTEFGLFPRAAEMAERAVGTATLEGSTTTWYVFDPVAACQLQGPAESVHQRLGPFEIWVDGRDRLVQARTTVTSVLPTGTARTTATVALHDFGAPAHIAPPRRIGRGVEAGVTVGIAGVRSSSSC